MATDRGSSRFFFIYNSEPNRINCTIVQKFSLRDPNDPFLQSGLIILKVWMFSAFSISNK